MSFQYYTIRYDTSVYLTCSKKLTSSQLSPPYGLSEDDDGDGWVTKLRGKGTGTKGSMAFVRPAQSVELFVNILHHLMHLESLCKNFWKKFEGILGDHAS